MVCSKPRSSAAAGRDAASRPSSATRWNGSTGSTPPRRFSRTHGVHLLDLLEPIGNIPSAEAEANFYAVLDTDPLAA